MFLSNRNIIKTTFNRLLKIITLKRSNATWYPDSEYMQQFMGPIMYPNEITSKWKQGPWSGRSEIKEMSVKNMFLNVGCAHPAVHGVLRLVAELDGEASSKCGSKYVLICINQKYWVCGMASGIFM